MSGESARCFVSTPGPLTRRAVAQAEEEVADCEEHGAEDGRLLGACRGEISSLDYVVTAMLLYRECRECSRWEGRQSERGRPSVRLLLALSATAYVGDAGGNGEGEVESGVLLKVPLADVDAAVERFGLTCPSQTLQAPVSESLLRSPGSQ
jgi:hypothetical protein